METDVIVVVVVVDRMLCDVDVMFMSIDGGDLVLFWVGESGVGGRGGGVGIV